MANSANLTSRSGVRKLVTPFSREYFILRNLYAPFSEEGPIHTLVGLRNLSKPFFHEHTNFFNPLQSLLKKGHIILTHGKSKSHGLCKHYRITESGRLQYIKFVNALCNELYILENLHLPFCKHNPKEYPEKRLEDPNKDLTAAQLKRRKARLAVGKKIRATRYNKATPFNRPMISQVVEPMGRCYYMLLTVAQLGKSMSMDELKEATPNTMSTTVRNQAMILKLNDYLEHCIGVLYRKKYTLNSRGESFLAFAKDAIYREIQHSKTLDTAGLVDYDVSPAIPKIHNKCPVLS